MAVDTFLYHQGKGDLVGENSRLIQMFKVGISGGSQGLWWKLMEEGGWKSEWSWVRRGHGVRSSWVRKACKGEVRDRSSREERRRGEREVTGSEPPGALLIPGAAPCSLSLFVFYCFQNFACLLPFLLLTLRASPVKLRPATGLFLTQRLLIQANGWPLGF